MLNGNQTHVGEMQVRKRRLQENERVPAPQTDSGIEWVTPVKKRRGEKLLSNLAVASALVLCAVTLRTGALPTLSGAGDALMAAATYDQSLDDDLLNDQLGRLSFVSALFPEATLVFGESGDDELALPVSGGTVVHAWSEAEPYMAWQSRQQEVCAAADGEVIGVYHGNGEERLVQVMGHDGLACLYGNLGEVNVAVGDAVFAGDQLGTLMTGANCVFEVRRDGLSIDPALYMRSR